MSTSIIDKLFAAGDALSGKFFRVIGGKDKSANAQPFLVGPFNEGYHRNVGENGRAAYVTGFNELRVTGEARRLVGAHFNNATFDTNKWSSTLANGGTATPGAGVLPLATNTTANGSSIVQSLRRARSIPGICNQFIVGMFLGDTGVANNVRRWGASDGTDGLFFELNGTTFNIVTLKNGTRAVTANGSFNGNNGATLTVDTAFHTWEISFIGPTYAEFYIDGVLLHKTASPTLAAGALMTNSDLPIRFEDTNSAGVATNEQLLVAFTAISRLTSPTVKPDYFHFAPGVSAALTQTLKTGAGTFYSCHVSQAGNAGTTITVYDNTAASGTIIDVVDGTSIAELDYGEDGVDFSVGLTIAVTAAVKPTAGLVLYD